MIFIHCKQAVDLISKREEAKLSRMDAVQLRMHLLICKGCRRFEKQNAVMIAAMRKYDAEGGEKGLSDAEKEEMVRGMTDETV